MTLDFNMNIDFNMHSVVNVSWYSPWHTRESIWEDVIPTRVLSDSASTVPTKPMTADAANSVPDSLTILYTKMSVVDDCGRWVGCANPWAVVISKNASTALFVFHLVALKNKTYGKERQLDALKEPHDTPSLWGTHFGSRACERIVVSRP